ncbi:MAG: hypothetical protein COT74_13875 [Bdellovibrionales bacterium CG10_big_fil_rev_8_21_14_0_10_45_34]|nr:MAG: hypothetical protein COT74_13875 [Bdellovibrionales bacterium CG10_big_fil_rev_8_21_14_0_10_45_34]
MRFFGSKEIKDIVASWVSENRESLKNKTVVDAPAGNGVTSEYLAKAGACVLPYDLFPEFFRLEDISCQKADISDGLPLDSDSVDFWICQEGIEHLSDQVKVFEEFSRVLKFGGRLLLTTPNASNLKSRFSYLLGESESFSKLLPPNEVDTIWFAPNECIYFGHAFLVGFFKLRFFGKLSGLELRKIHSTRVNHTAAILFLFLYPLICWSNFRAAARFRRANPQIDRSFSKELFRYSISPKVLLENHLFLEFEKVSDSSEAKTILKTSKDAHSFCT